MSQVILDVGGVQFRTTRTTLTWDTTCFFSRMLSETWQEGQQDHGGDTSGETSTPNGKSNHSQGHVPVIFIDRDPHCFPAILSYLRSQQAFLPADCDKGYLEKLLVEADYYQLESLSECVRAELEDRSAKKEGGDDDTMSASELYRTVSPSEVQSYFDQGWAFVSSYEANETAACSATGSKVTATWRNSSCSVCGFAMTYDKFAKHCSFYRPTVVVVRRPKRGLGPHSTRHPVFVGSAAFSPFPRGLGSLGSPLGAGAGGGGGHISAVPFGGYGQIDVDSSFG